MVPASQLAGRLDCNFCAGRRGLRFAVTAVILPLAVLPCLIVMNDRAHLREPTNR